jgi:radical SAM-linked protein
MRVRLVYQKVDRARFLGNRELATAFMRASRRAGLPLAFSSGHHPMPRMSFGPALSLGFASYGEYIDIDLDAERSSRNVMNGLNRELPEGLTIVEAEAHGLDLPTIDRSLKAFTYSVSLDRVPPARIDDAALTARLAIFTSSTSFPITKEIKGRARTIDARATVAILRTGARTLQVETSVTRHGTLKPHHVVATILDLNDLETQLLTITKIATTLDAPRSAPPPLETPSHYVSAS